MEEKDYKVTKLPRNGPKPGQSVKAWLYGKSFQDKEWQKKVDDAPLRRR